MFMVPMRFKKKWRLPMNRVVATPVKAWAGSRNVLRPPAHAGSYDLWAVSRSEWNTELSINSPI